MTLNKIKSNMKFLKNTCFLSFNFNYLFFLNTNIFKIFIIINKKKNIFKF